MFIDARRVRTAVCAVVAITATSASGVTYFDAAGDDQPAIVEPEQTTLQPITEDTEPLNDVKPEPNDEPDADVFDPVSEGLHLVAATDPADFGALYDIGTALDLFTQYTLSLHQFKGVTVTPGNAAVVDPFSFLNLKFHRPTVMHAYLSNHNTLYVSNDEKAAAKAEKIGKVFRPHRIKPPGVLDVLFAIGAVVLMIVLLRRRDAAKKRRRTRRRGGHHAVTR